MKHVLHPRGTTPLAAAALTQSSIAEFCRGHSLQAVTGLPVRFYWAAGVDKSSGCSSGDSPVMAGSTSYGHYLSVPPPGFRRVRVPRSPDPRRAQPHRHQASIPRGETGSTT